MNVYLYVLVLLALGLGISYLVGKLGAGRSTAGAVVLFAIASVGLGVALFLPMLGLATRVCSFFGITRDTSCIATDDRTVWFLAFPLLAFPLYFVVMLYSRHANSASLEG